MLVEVPVLASGRKAQCPRCGSVLAAQYENAFDRILAFSLSALIFLISANSFSFLSLSVQGQERTITLLQSIQLLAGEGESLLALTLGLAVILLPALMLVGIFYMLMVIKYGVMTSKNRALLRFILMIPPWGMGEIFIVGVLISLIKIISLADVELGLSFWAYILFSVFMTATLLHIDRVQIWSWVERGGNKVR